LLRNGQTSEMKLPNSVLPGVCEPGSARSICVGCTPSTFEAAKGTPERVHCTVLRTRNSLDLCMVNLMEDSEEHELGPWHLSLEVAGGSSFGQFYTLMRFPTCSAGSRLLKRSLGFRIVFVICPLRPTARITMHIHLVSRSRPLKRSTACPPL